MCLRVSLRILGITLCMSLPTLNKDNCCILIATAM